MKTMSISEVRDQLPDTVSRVRYQGERVCVARHGKQVAAIVSVEDAALLEALEDSGLALMVREALAEGGESVAWDDLRRELKL